jgi:hypothetical protein
VATRKQRARRAKTFRHDYGFVVADDEGNDVEVAGSELRAKKDGKDAPAKASSSSSKQSSSRGGRSGREPQPPSWNRALKRGAMWGAGLVVISVLLLRGVPLATRVVIGIVYAALFIPMTYWLDGLVYRRFQARKSRPPAGRAGKSRQ